MHDINEIGYGRIRGWAEASSDGCPATLMLECQGQRVAIFATEKRPDVLAAGYSLFSGFNLYVSGDLGVPPCSFMLGEVTRVISPIELPVSELVTVDDRTEDSISGWINHGEGLRSLVFYHTQGITRANLYHRDDVNLHMKSNPKLIHGFQVHAIDVSAIYAININNERVHWLGSRALA